MLGCAVEWLFKKGHDLYVIESHMVYREFGTRNTAYCKETTYDYKFGVVNKIGWKLGREFQYGYNIFDQMKYNIYSKFKNIYIESLLSFSSLI